MNGVWDHGGAYWFVGVRETTNDAWEPQALLKRDLNGKYRWWIRSRFDNRQASCAGSKHALDFPPPEKFSAPYDTAEEARDDAVFWVQGQILRGHLKVLP